MTSQINALNEADKTLHSLAQLIAQTGMQVLPIQADDSQTNMNWNNEQHRLEGRLFAHEAQQARLVINIKPLELQFLTDSEQVLTAFSPENKTPADALAWWQSQMRSSGVTDFRTLNYQLDQSPMDDQAVYAKSSDFDEWKHWRTLANDALYALNDSSGRISEVRIWPHHFDTGVYYSIPGDDGQERAAIWAGYAIADAVSEVPYFYLSGYRSGQSIDFQNAPGLSVGKWVNTPDWKGAALPVSQQVDAKQIRHFFQESYNWLAEQVNT